MKPSIRISFIGDLMCDRALLLAACQNGTYEFSRVFRNVAPLFAASDLVVGNFETVLGGREPYRGHGFIYNSPDAFAEAIRDAGVDVLTTANNHAMDGGIVGLERTVSRLQAMGFSTVGTGRSMHRRPLILTVQGVRLAFLSYTEFVNNRPKESDPSAEIPQHVNLLRPLKTKAEIQERVRGNYHGFKGAVLYYAAQILQWPCFSHVRKAIGNYRRRKRKKIMPSVTDVLTEYHQDPASIQRLRQETADAKANADVVFVCCHAGGQLNEIPGSYMHYLADLFCRNGADVLIGNHPHVIQNVEIDDAGHIVAYCLGSMTQTPDGEYKDHPLLPYYSMVLHVDIDVATKCPVRCSYSLVRAIADHNRYIELYPVEILMDECPEMKQEIMRDVHTLECRIRGAESGNSVGESNVLWTAY